jgi:peptide/nickel transport system permease protein
VTAYLVRRLLALIPVMAVVVTIVFFIIHLIPGDPVSVMLGPQAQVGEAVKDRIRADLGLDRPLWQQYLSMLGDLLRGDLGTSYQLRLPVSEVIGRQLGATLQLTGLALAIAVLLAFAGVLLARRPFARGLSATGELIVRSTPVIWIGLLLRTVFAFGLGWFPVAGSRTGASLVLPAVTLALPVAALLGQVVRDGVEAAERQPWALTVRARGADHARLTLRHTLRHGSIGALTLSAYLVGSLLGGAVLVETVFARPGLGRVTLAAITGRDLPVVTGIILFSALVFVVVNTAVELAAPFLDPRLRGARVPTAPAPARPEGAR